MGVASPEILVFSGDRESRLSSMRLVLGVSCALLLTGSVASAATLHVPGEYPTIAAALDAAAVGDRIEVTGGRNCGAAVAKRVALVGREGASIVGCAHGPTLRSG